MPVVKVGYKIENIGEIDCLRSIFFAHFKLFVSWTDPKLIGSNKARAQELEIRRYRDKMTPNRGQDTDWSLIGLYDPGVMIVNNHSLQTNCFEMKLSNPAKGTVKWTRHTTGWCEHDVGKSLLVSPAAFFRYPQLFLYLMLLVSSCASRISHSIFMI
jgi:hypothetical protein